MTKDLQASRDFYIGLLGLEETAWRPNFPFDGAWLKIGLHAIVHLTVRDFDRGDENTQPFDHFALKAENIKAMRKSLEAAGVAYKEQNPPNSNIHQIFIHDPDGVAVELNFNTDYETAAGTM
jgi:catechol 2,3-dioxygenase-like lactoylglutathione lyase family enzyme